MTYKIVRPGLRIGDPDIVLSRHRSLEAAQKAFDRVDLSIGPHRLIDSNGKTINSCII